MSASDGSSVQIYTKPRARDFGDMPLDTVWLLDVMSGLSSLQLGVHMCLRAAVDLEACATNVAALLPPDPPSAVTISPPSTKDTPIQ